MKANPAPVIDLLRRIAFVVFVFVWCTLMTPICLIYIWAIWVWEWCRA